MLVAACVPSPRPSASPDESTSPAPPTPATSASPEQEASLSAILLEEVLFNPVPGRSAFVELANLTAAPADLTPLTVTLGGPTLPLALAGSTLGPGERILITLDGAATVDGHAIHASADYALSPTSGAVELLGPDGVVIDRVAWGDDPQAVRLGSGGVATDEIEAGSSIGRPPGASAPEDRTSWVVYGPAEASPGEPNPLPRVAILLPFNGALFETPNASLTWYPVTGASSYRVQVAADQTFDAPLVDVTVLEPEVETNALSPGPYRWRVASIATDGTEAAFSEPSSFEVAGGTRVALAIAAPRLPSGVDAPSNPLAVPMIYQHKDTPMLLLERNLQLGRHAWDLDHGVLDKNDPADNMNCVPASVAMLNHFSGGDLSQDRIGYEVFKGRAPGPERDLNYGDGMDPEVALAFAFAAGSPTVSHPVTAADLWAVITSSIDRGVPLLAVAETGPTSSHAFVVTGYGDFFGNQTITVNDPYSGPRTHLLDAVVADGGWDIWQLGFAARARTQEPSVNMDSDGDGVVDFDELNRFQTDPNLADSDLDDVLDKEDIAASVFDRTYGYAAHPNRGGRDFDSDGLAIEHDPDADDGGCEDGAEDTNVNGKRDPGETWNFKASDDKCLASPNGTVTYTSVYRIEGDDGSFTESRETMSVSVSLAAAPSGAPRLYVDAGSTFTASIATRSLTYGVDGCEIRTVGHGSAGGTFPDPGDFGASMAKQDNGEWTAGVSASALVTVTVVTNDCVQTYSNTIDRYVQLVACEGPEINDADPQRTFNLSCLFDSQDGLYSYSLTGTLTFRR